MSMQPGENVQEESGPMVVAVSSNTMGRGESMNWGRCS